ncbi:hypothetical protein AArcSl_3252 [Halalkaliarchaeum desulfuricum]|uniref:DUF1508 domain-containing protein n=1 Tax=Halalkaliarchaeum desulfuricum TaxID=2055893 RepID=A0A343TP36_9EURY|nr:DUF1508 domain-containing protein [Halalkaliarchaeum desulfuricum]AUX10858.1 hypothetical protein AArcSl_3252 [Halalkaliarchaeum desulfuricum]
MSDQQPSGTLQSLYTNRIGTARTDDEIFGYWLFLLGVIAGLLGVVVFAFTDAQTMSRGIGYALAALAPPLIMLGAVIRFPLRRTAMWLAVVGGLLSVVAVVWFLSVFPDGWPRATGRADIIGVYAVGLIVIGLAGTVVPLWTDPVYDEHAQLTETTERQRQELEMSSARAEESTSRAEELEGDLAAGQEELAEIEEKLSQREAEIEALHSSSARFELFEDRGGKHRWRLRHRNGNVIAAAGQGYSSRQKCQQGMHSVMRNALGAGVLRLESEAVETTTEDGEPVPEDADEPDIAVPSVEEDLESAATYEVFEDEGGRWRWRLRHENGNIIADSGEGYASKSNARRAMRNVRDHVSAADYLDIDPAAFEVYRDRAGQYRWRLLHENGNILADSGQGYTRRSDARNGLESVRTNVNEAPILDPGTEPEEETNTDAVFEVYEDKGGEWRWRLRHQNGNIIADSGEGYASRSGCIEAVDRIREYAPEADILDVERAAFEVYEDAAGEWRWRLRHRNGNIIADSGEGYASRSGCIEAVERVKRHAPGAGDEEVEA